MADVDPQGEGVTSEPWLLPPGFFPWFAVHLNCGL